MQLYVYIENKVHPLYIKSFLLLGLVKDINKDNCNICLSDFKTNEKLLKMKCGNLLNIKCLREWLKKI